MEGGEHTGTGSILDNQAVAHANDPLGVLGDIVFMRNHDDGLAGLIEPAEHRHDLLAGDAIEVAGRLVGENDIWVVDE